MADHEDWRRLALWALIDGLNNRQDGTVIRQAQIDWLVNEIVDLFEQEEPNDG